MPTRSGGEVLAVFVSVCFPPEGYLAVTSRVALQGRPEQHLFPRRPSQGGVTSPGRRGRDGRRRDQYGWPGSQ